MSRAMERMLRLLEEIRDNTESGNSTSSIEIEDLASKSEPKVTTKVYVGSLLTQADIDLVLQAHAYAKRRARDMSLNGWQETIDMLGVQKLSDRIRPAAPPRQAPNVEEYDLEELPDFEEVKQ